MEAARHVKSATIDRELLWAVIGSRIWPAYLMPPRAPQVAFPLVLCIQTPSGPLYYRLRADEAESGLFDHLERRPANDGSGYVSGLDKLATLHTLALNGWHCLSLTAARLASAANGLAGRDLP